MSAMLNQGIRLNTTLLHMFGLQNSQWRDEGRSVGKVLAAPTSFRRNMPSLEVLVYGQSRDTSECAVLFHRPFLRVVRELSGAEGH